MISSRHAETATRPRSGALGWIENVAPIPGRDEPASRGDPHQDSGARGKALDTGFVGDALHRAGVVGPQVEAHPRDVFHNVAPFKESIFGRN